MHVGDSTTHPSSSFYPLLSEAKKGTVSRLMKVAKEGIKELNVDNSGNTIIHDALHLHDYRLFKLIFKEGSPALERYSTTPNAAGATPLLEAAKEGSVEIVEELRRHGGCSIRYHQPVR